MSTKNSVKRDFIEYLEGKVYVVKHCLDNPKWASTKSDEHKAYRRYARAELDFYKDLIKSLKTIHNN